MIVKREDHVKQPCFSAEFQGKNPRKVLVNKTISVTAATGSKDQIVSQDGSVALRIIKQPEAQHRARYLTEGSRGSVKDRSGSGYPTVVIEGYNKPAVLEIFIGSETGKPLPHLFYQVCRVAGKSPSSSKQVRRDGTNYLQLQSEQRRGNMFVCDCIGILKERFSDVEGRFPNDSQWKEAKRKSTSCRIVFQTTVQTLLGNLETLQIASEEINCTQLPGTPEILKMNIKKASMVGGEELWIIARQSGANLVQDCVSNERVLPHQSSDCHDTTLLHHDVPRCPGPCDGEERWEELRLCTFHVHCRAPRNF